MAWRVNNSALYVAQLCDCCCFVFCFFIDAASAINVGPIAAAVYVPIIIVSETCQDVGSRARMFAELLANFMLDFVVKALENVMDALGLSINTTAAGTFGEYDFF